MVSVLRLGELRFTESSDDIPDKYRGITAHTVSHQTLLSFNFKYVFLFHELN